MRLSLLSLGLVFLLGNCQKSSEPAAPVAALPDPLGTPVQLSLQPSQPGAPVADHFLGLSFETTAITNPDYFNSGNAAFVQLIRNLGPGVLRIGANGVDRTDWTGGPRQTSTPANGITTTDVDRFAAFAQASGWPVIFGLNLGNYRPAQAASEAQYVGPALGPLLQSFEIGNEPDLYARNGLRPASYGYANFRQEWETYVQTIRATLPAASFSGPAVAYSAAWAVPFAADERSRITLLTAHHYHMGPGSDSTMTITRLLNSEAGLQNYCGQLQAAARANNLPYRLAECNSVYGGGRMGVSNTLAAALWGLDMLWTVAENGGVGVNFHGGGNGAYTPIAWVNGTFVARPLYYGLLAFGSGSNGQLIPSAFTTNGLNLKAHAVRRPDGALLVTLINNTPNSPAAVQLATGGATYRQLSITRLTGASLAATDGVQWGGASPALDGSLSNIQTSQYTLAAGSTPTVNLPAASAAVVVLQP